MLSLKTDWSKIRYIMCVLFTINVLLASTVATGLTTSGKQKRQLFREHLLPEQGGKIPEAAFHPDRILLNKYQQNGFYLPDGYHLLQRNTNRLFPHNQYQSNTIKIHIAPDNRYVAPEGQIFTPLTVDTTYLVREPVKYTITPQFYLNYNCYPLLPYESLRILRKFKYSKINNGLLKDNISLSPDDYASQIFLELSPYLRQLHATD